VLYVWREIERSGHLTYLVFIEIPQWLDDLAEGDRYRHSSHIVMAFYAALALDSVWIDGPLKKGSGSGPIRFTFEDADKPFSDHLSLLLRITDPAERRKEFVMCIDYLEI
jgi:hypothetical protein